MTRLDGDTGHNRVPPPAPLPVLREVRTPLGELPVRAWEEAHLGDRYPGVLGPAKSQCGDPRPPHIEGVSGSQASPQAQEGMSQKSGCPSLAALGMELGAGPVPWSPFSSPVPWAQGGEGLGLRVWTQVSREGGCPDMALVLALLGVKVRNEGMPPTAESLGLRPPLPLLWAMGRGGTGGPTDFSGLWLVAGSG